MESLLGGGRVAEDDSLRKLIDSLRRPTVCSAGMLSRLGPTPPFRMLTLSLRGGGGAREPRRRAEKLPCTSHFLSTVWVTTDTRRSGGLTVQSRNNASSRLTAVVLMLKDLATHSLTHRPTLAPAVLLARSLRDCWLAEWGPPPLLKITLITASH